MAEKKQTGGTGKRAKSEKPAVLSGTVPEWSSTTVISQLLGKTVRRVQQLTQEGVLETEIPPGGGARKYRTCATVQRYVAYVEAKAQETGENSRAARLRSQKWMFRLAHSRSSTRILMKRSRSSTPEKRSSRSCWGCTPCAAARTRNSSTVTQT